MKVAALSLQQGHPPVCIVEDAVPDLQRFFTDDLYLRPASAGNQSLIQGEVHGKKHHNAVEQLLRGVEHQLHQHDDKVKHPQAYGHRNAQELFENQRRNVHSAGGCPRPDDQTQGNAQAQAAEHRAQQQIPGNHLTGKKPLKQLQKDGVQERAGDGGHGEFPPQHRPAQNQHHHIKYQNKGGHRNAPKRLCQQGKPRGSAADQLPGQDEQNHRQGQEQIADQNRQQVRQTPAYFLFHSFPSRISRNVR